MLSCGECCLQDLQEMARPMVEDARSVWSWLTQEVSVDSR